MKANGGTVDGAHFDGAAVMIGEDMEASILITANLKELGVTRRRADRDHGPRAIVLPERFFAERT